MHGRGGRVRFGIQERTNRGHTSDSVRDGVVHLDEQTHPPAWEPREQPHLPEWPGPIQALSSQALDGPQKCRFVTRLAKRRNPYVVGHVERGSIHPQRPAQAAPRLVEQLAEPGHQW